jgi:hypothetical protein
MSKKNPIVLSIFLALFSLIFAGELKAQFSNPPRLFRERSVIRAVRTIHSAEATYQATTGAGLYGSLEDLRSANLLDDALASGNKYGYLFVLSKTAPTATMPAMFQLTAIPRSYPKAGRYSFYIDQYGDIHAGDKNGAVATTNDSIIDDCSLYGDIETNERCVRLTMRTLFSAENTYFTINGSGNYGTFSELFAAGLISRRMAFGINHGYLFTAVSILPTPNSPASFTFRAIPENYGVTGIRSFYIDPSGILRGADKQGQPANQNDPPIDN